MKPPKLTMSATPGIMLEMARDHPVLNAAQLRDADAVAGDAVAVDLANRGRERRELRLHPRAAGRRPAAAPSTCWRAK